MKWILVFGNLVAAASLLGLGDMAAAAHKAHVYSTYRGFVREGVLDESNDSEQRFDHIAASGAYYRWLARAGAAACLINAIVIGVSLPSRSVCTYTRTPAQKPN